MESGCSYVIKDEVSIGLYGNTTLVVMEEGEERGACMKRAEQTQATMHSRKDPARFSLLKILRAS